MPNELTQKHAPLLEKTVALGHPYYTAFALSLLADAYKKVGRADLELETFARIVALPLDQKALIDPRWAATCYQKLGDYPSAHAVLSEALKIVPNEPDMIAALCEVSLFGGNFDEVDELAKNLSERPVPKYQILGRLMEAFGLALRGRHDESAKILQWIGQYVIAGRVIPPETWDYRDLRQLLDKMGTSAPVAGLVLDVLSGKNNPAEFARLWNQNAAVAK